MWGFQVLCRTPTVSSLCFEIPEEVFNQRLFFIWPRTSTSADGQCICLPNRPARFSSCSKMCGSIYQFTVNSRDICLNTSGLQDQEPLRVYLILDDDVCQNVQCFVTTFISSYLIGMLKQLYVIARDSFLCILAACNEQTPQTHILHSESHFNGSNYTLHLNQNLTLPLCLNNSSCEDEPALKILWMYNGCIISFAEDTSTTITGDRDLALTQVQPSNAGYYSLITSNDLQCGSSHFTVAIECEQNSGLCINKLATSQVVRWQLQWM